MEIPGTSHSNAHLAASTIHVKTIGPYNLPSSTQGTNCSYKRRGVILHGHLTSASSIVHICDKWFNSTKVLPLLYRNTLELISLIAISIMWPSQHELYCKAYHGEHDTYRLYSLWFHHNTIYTYVKPPAFDTTWWLYCHCVFQQINTCFMVILHLGHESKFRISKLHINTILIRGSTL